jgi:hypothetical protein
MGSAYRTRTYYSPAREDKKRRALGLRTGMLGAPAIQNERAVNGREN